MIRTTIIFPHLLSYLTEIVPIFLSKAPSLPLTPKKSQRFRKGSKELSIDLNFHSSNSKGSAKVLKGFY
jgi:hypothetical protein